MCRLIWALLAGMCWSRGEGGGGTRVKTTLEKSQKYSFLAIQARIPCKNCSFQARIQCWAIIGTPAKLHLMAFCWRANDGLLLVVLDPPSPSQLKKQNKKLQRWTPSGKNFLDPHMASHAINAEISSACYKIITCNCFLFAPWEIFQAFLSSADFFQYQLFRKNLSGIPSECQTDWIQTRPDVLSGLIWVQSVCKGYEQTTLGGNDLIPHDKRKIHKQMYLCIICRPFSFLNTIAQLTWGCRGNLQNHLTNTCNIIYFF